MDIPDFQDDLYLKVLRPLVEAYLAFARADNRHIRGMRLTPSQFDVISTLGDTESMTCAELSASTLVTKGTLTGVLDRLESKGLIRRDVVESDRRRTKIRLTEKGQTLFEKIFPACLEPERRGTGSDASAASARQFPTFVLRHRSSEVTAGCPKRPSSAAAASEEATRTCGTMGLRAMRE